MIHPDDAAALSIADGSKVILGNQRGEVRIHAKIFEGVRRGVLIAESIWPNDAYEDGRGINTLTGADPIAPMVARRSMTIVSGSGPRRNHSPIPSRHHTQLRISM